MAAEDRLRTYRGKRDFERTREPSGGQASGGGGRPRFVVQIHDEIGRAHV